MSAVNLDEFRAFLDLPLVAHLVTLRPGGAPHVAPVWFAYGGGKFRVYTSRKFQKTRNIERDNRVALSIATPGEPYSYVVAEGEAAILTEAVAETGRAIAARYIGAGNLEAIDQFMAETLNESAVVLEITPSRVMTWSE